MVISWRQTNLKGYNLGIPPKMKISLVKSFIDGKSQKSRKLIIGGDMTCFPKGRNWSKPTLPPVSERVKKCFLNNLRNPCSIIGLGRFSFFLYFRGGGDKL